MFGLHEKKNVWYSCSAVAVQKAQVIKLGQLHAFSVKASSFSAPETVIHAFHQTHSPYSPQSPLVGLGRTGTTAEAKPT
jgi:hypothetical protein